MPEKNEITDGGRYLQTFAVMDLDVDHADPRAFLDDRCRGRDRGVGAAQKVDVQIRCGEIHLALEAGRQSARGCRISEHAEDPAVDGAGCVVELGLELDRHHAAVGRQFQDVEFEEPPYRMRTDPFFQPADLLGHINSHGR